LTSGKISNALVDEGVTTIVGDPMEKAALDSLGWAIEDNGIVRALTQAEKDAVVEKEKLKKEGILANIKAKAAQNGTASGGGKEKKSGQPQTFHLKIERRFQFSSALKRMSTIAVIPQQVKSSRRTLVSVKGAPETIRTMLKAGTVPGWYEHVYKDLMRKGGRVLALASKEETWNKDQILKVSREDVECNLTFRGFLLFSCPLKPDAVSTLKMIGDASHRVCFLISIGV
jgi:manganese-transporting P-type ATPase